MSKPVVTRFAPSPTGYLHIGGARTALFNWLFARANKGKYLLRIEDTDRARSTQDAIDAILDGLEWLGFDHDEPPLFQSSRSDRHVQIANELLETGHAYKCYASPEELEEMREKARAEKRPPIYDGRWRDRDPADAPPGVAPAIRFKAPTSGTTVIADVVQGDVSFQNENLDDLILLRSDGTPTYMLSVIVDDHDMGVTHIIRGDDHLTNAARQKLIIEALGWPVPTYAHVPLIHGPDGAKLSKRHGALGVDAYRSMGYLPEALRNYLVRLGWSHGDDEIFSTEQLLEWFDLEGIGKAAARFDTAKLDNLNGHYIRELEVADLTARVRQLMESESSYAQLVARLTDEDWHKLAVAMPGLRERAKTLVELIENAAYLFAERPLTMDPKAAKHLDEAGRSHLTNLLPKLEALDDWSPDTIEAALRDYVTETDSKLGQVAQPLRSALTGKTTSPGIFDVVHVLGQQAVSERIRDQITQ